jgi:hypothetical protein
MKDDDPAALVFRIGNRRGANWLKPRGYMGLGLARISLTVTMRGNIRRATSVVSALATRSARVRRPIRRVTDGCEEDCKKGHQEGDEEGREAGCREGDEGRQEAGKEGRQEAGKAPRREETGEEGRQEAGKASGCCKAPGRQEDREACRRPEEGSHSAPRRRQARKGRKSRQAREGRKSRQAREGWKERPRFQSVGTRTVARRRRIGPSRLIFVKLCATLSTTGDQCERAWGG